MKDGNPMRLSLEVDGGRWRGAPGRTRLGPFPVLVSSNSVRATATQPKPSLPLELSRVAPAWTERGKRD
jgi:hypothetical protein